ncbi:MAG: uracil-DNA glycosylase [Anaerolineaceae bacterium]|nr:uracil-DNA glycosylase [Anaerolineaceae bacterium]
MDKSVREFSDWASLNECIETCRICTRLVEWRELVSRQKRRAYLDENYWGKGVPGFGDLQARVLVVGLAPGAHGSNRTGRMFTGDASGDFLFPALHQAGFATQPNAESREDTLELIDLFISAICRCAPPDNKPKPDEIRNCLGYLHNEISLLSKLQGVVCLGKLSFDQIVRHYVLEQSARKKYVFKHLAFYPAGDLPFWLLSSYHPSRQNTQTGRLTKEMFAAVWETVCHQLEEKSDFREIN